MILHLKKFGTTLIGHELGSEAFKAFQSTLGELKPNESIEIDFEGVITFSPSWGDEFLTPLLLQLGDRLVLFPSDNPSVKATLDILEQITKKKFKILL